MLQPSAHVRAAVISLAVLSCVAAAGDVSQTGIATVTLSVPYPTILRDEVVRFTVVLRNDSQQGLRYIADPHEVAGKQVFMTAERGSPGIIKRLEGKSVPDSERVRSIDHDGNWVLVVKEATATLQPGQSVEWDGSRFDGRLFRITWGRPKSLQAQVLIGPNQWVSSKPVPIKVIEQDLSSSPLVFETQRFVAPLKINVPVKVRRVTIEGKDYLFGEGCHRICEVPRGAKPEFDWDPETNVLTVRFPGFDVCPLHYEYHQMRPLPKPPEKTPSRQ